MNKHIKNDLKQGQKPKTNSSRSRGASVRAQTRNQSDADKKLDIYKQTTENGNPESLLASNNQLKITFLGGLYDVGEKNMAVIEYNNDAIILDCGMNLGIDLPGVNYAINNMSYLETIKHKIKGYVITHGHLDHIGGLKHTVPKYPAPIYGSRYTIGVIERTFEDELLNLGDFKPNLQTVNIDNQEHLRIGVFGVEFIRVTHAIPDPAAVCISTPVGKIIATGDFRLDPEPLDNLPSNVNRLIELGNEGILLLMSDSSYADAPGRTPTEHTLQESFEDLITKATGRIFVAVFSSNINRTQMIINAAVRSGRKVALDGRSMLGYVEIAVRQGILKVPKGTIIPINQANSLAPDQVLVMCTGGQGEPNAALQRMSEGEHKHINLSTGDTVIISSSPIPGNEVSYDQLSNRLKKAGVFLYRHPTHEIDGCGPLHVSGHAKRDELREMINMVKPKFFIPVHAGTLRRHYHAELAIEENIKRENTLLPENGDTVHFTKGSMSIGQQKTYGSLLVDQNGSLIEHVVVKDRVILGQSGIISIVLTIDKQTGQVINSPDIISRGVIDMKNNADLLNELRSELRRAVSQRFKRVDSDRFKAEIREFATQFIYDRLGLSPIIIPVINTTVSNKRASQPKAPNVRASSASNPVDDQKRFQEMRARLLSN